MNVTRVEYSVFCMMHANDSSRSNDMIYIRRLSAGLLVDGLTKNPLARPNLIEVDISTIVSTVFARIFIFCFGSSRPPATL